MIGLGTGKKGQGSLEYLIILAAVLAIAAVVVLFVTGAFSGAKTSVTDCKTASSQCAVELAGNTAAPCGSCDTKCAGGVAIATNATDITYTAGAAGAIEACHDGATDHIASP
ncbi:MAG: class III signal peptide-containing protein [Candidatus Micrarchaeota archaeon]